MAPDVDPVRMWRPAGSPVLLMRGLTNAYAVEPNGEYFIGVIARRAMAATRGAARHVVRPGELVAWDPSGAHRGRPADGGADPWLAHLLVIELPALREVLRDGDRLPPDIEFPAPVIADRSLAVDFVALHRLLTRPAGALEHDTALAAWLHRVAALSPATSRKTPDRRVAMNDPALRRACEYLDDRLAENTTLDELARVAGVGKFRLIRLFRAGLGVPPHRYQLAQRLRLARRLLERGEPIASAAATAGFVDQSHMHRHFRRGLGVTPRQYVARLGGASGAARRP
jgi:AraC-like DNA-binding protein